MRRQHENFAVVRQCAEIPANKHIHPKLMSLVFAVVRLGCSAARNNEFMDVSWEGFVCVKSILDGLLEGHRPALLPCFLETGLTQP